MKGWLSYSVEKYGRLKLLIGIDGAGFVREVVYPDKPPWTPETVCKELKRHWGHWQHETRFISASEFVEELEQKFALLKELVQEGEGDVQV